MQLQVSKSVIEQAARRKKEEERLKNFTGVKYDIVVPVSGGKDSQACLKLAVEKVGCSKVLGLFCDTQFEHPLTYKHVEKLKTLYGEVRIDTITGGSVPEKVRKYNRFPGGGARHCTSELKLAESKKFYKALAEMQGGFEVWIGVRSGESSDRKKRYEHIISSELHSPHELYPSDFPKYLANLGVMFRLPILDWEEIEVLEFIGKEKNPLYNQGFGRVGCFPCLASGDKWKEKAFHHDEFGRKQYEIVKILEKDIGVSIWKSKSGKERNSEDNPGCSFCQM